MKLYFISMLLCLPMAVQATASQHTDPFPHFDILTPNVNFWIKVYSQYETTQGIVHDSRNLNIIYDIIELEHPDQPVAYKINNKRTKKANDRFSKILKILQEKARIPNVEVARQVGLVPSAVLECIRKLEKQGYIDGYEVRLNPERFKRSLVAFIQLTIDPAINHNKISDSLLGIDWIQEIHHVAGEDGFLLKVRVAGTDELGRLVSEQIGTLSGIRATRTMIVMSTKKETARIPIDDKDLLID